MTGSVKLQLPVIELTSDRRRQRWLTPLVHGARAVCVLLLLIGIHRAIGRANGRIPVQDQAQQNANELISSDPLTLRLVDNEGAAVGVAIQTSPLSDSLVGYSGPSNVLITLTPDGRVGECRLISSPDTREHVRRVVTDKRFWQQFSGVQPAEAESIQLDGVTGATLTSLSIAQAVRWRLMWLSYQSSDPSEQPLPGHLPLHSLQPPEIGSQPSLRFPDPISLDLLRRWYPSIVRLTPFDDAHYRFACWDDQGQSLGTVIRTGPLHDAEIGYQGPTELLLRLNPDDPSVVTDVMIASSFDNEPYVGYVRQERSFWRHFRGSTILELAEIDFDERLIDGVSGATMTSMAAAQTLRQAATALQRIGEQRQAENTESTAQDAASLNTVDRLQTPPQRAGAVWNWSLNEIGTACLAATAILWSRSRLRGQRRARLVWQIVCWVWLSWASGHLLSLTLLGGWLRSGGAWQLAPGLATLLLVAALGPVFFKGNVYCDHLCPHGILQQWLRPRQQRPVPRAMRWILLATATVSLGYALLVGIWLAGNRGMIPLAWLEPFDGYATLRLVRWGTDGWTTRQGGSLGDWVIVIPSLLILVGSLLAARRWPMIYCRLGCPTGRGLDYLRSDATRHRIQVIDGVLLLALIGVWCW